MLVRNTYFIFTTTDSFINLLSLHINPASAKTWNHFENWHWTYLELFIGPNCIGLRTKLAMLALGVPNHTVGLLQVPRLYLVLPVKTHNLFIVIAHFPPFSIALPAHSRALFEFPLCHLLPCSTLFPKVFFELAFQVKPHPCCWAVKATETLYVILHYKITLKLPWYVPVCVCFRVHVCFQNCQAPKTDSMATWHTDSHVGRPCVLFTGSHTRK